MPSKLPSSSFLLLLLSVRLKMCVCCTIIYNYRYRKCTVTHERYTDDVMSAGILCGTQSYSFCILVLCTCWIFSQTKMRWGGKNHSQIHAPNTTIHVYIITSFCFYLNVCVCVYRKSQMCSVCGVLNNIFVDSLPSFY